MQVSDSVVILTAPFSIVLIGCRFPDYRLGPLISILFEIYQLEHSDPMLCCASQGRYW